MVLGFSANILFGFGNQCGFRFSHLVSSSFVAIMTSIMRSEPRPKTLLPRNPFIQKSPVILCAVSVLIEIYYGSAILNDFCAVLQFLLGPNAPFIIGKAVYKLLNVSSLFPSFKKKQLKINHESGLYSIYIAGVKTK